MADVTAPQFQQDVNKTSEWANGDENTTVTMRLGQQARSPAKVIKDIQNQADAAILSAANNFNLTPSGFDFSVGGTLTSNNQTIEDSSGNEWIYTLEIPEGGYTVAAGTAPTAPPYKQVTYTDHNDASNRNAVGAHDAIYVRCMEVSEIITEDATSGTRYIATNLDNARYDVVDGGDSGGFYYATMASGRKLRYIPKSGVSKISQVGGTVNTDSAELLFKLAQSGAKKIEINVDILCATGDYTITESDLKIFGKGKILVDWDSVGYGDSGDEKWVYHFSGDNVLWKHVDSESLTGKVDPFVEQEFTSFLRFTGGKSKVRHTEANFHPNYVFSVMSEEGRFDFIGNEGEGQLVDGSAQTGTHCLLFQRNGTKGIHSHNEGSNFCNVILHGLSPKKTTVNYNKGFDCGNHVFYGSSTDYCHAQGNEAYGENTDFKLRGDGNVCIANIIEGGTFVMTNRVADTGNGFGVNKVTSINNVITCTRDTAIAYAIRGRTGFDSPAGDIVSSNNVIYSENTSPNAHVILFQSINSVSCSDKVTCSGVVNDGIRISPTDGITVDGVGRVIISDSYSVGATDQAYQIAAKDILMNGIVAHSDGGSGISGGVMSLRCEYLNLTSFSAKASNNIYVINILSLTEANIDVGNLERPSGATLPHIYAPSGILNEGLLITKVN